MVNIRKNLSIIFLGLVFSLNAQLKFLVEDFEGFADGRSGLTDNGIYTFGCINASVDGKPCNGKTYSGKKAIRIEKDGKAEFGGWGKGLTRNIELDQRTDYLNFYVLQESGGPTLEIKIELQEDDDRNGTYSKEHDDLWTCSEKVGKSGAWTLVSIPLSKFKDSNPGGDGGFDINYRHGKLFVINFTFVGADKIREKSAWYFDFLCFSKGPLQSTPTVGDKIFDAPSSGPQDFCALGAWSTEGNSANFADIAKTFESNFKSTGGAEKKLGVVHFFQPFSTEKDNSKYHYPSVERINKVIKAGYIPMITLEDHFVNSTPGVKQPNVYSILDGHFDSFFGYWAHQIKEVEGTVLLRILHEFNGDWYPWSTVKNDKDPYVIAKAFRYIRNIFNQNNVRNVKFIWCPNSMSAPQEEWNYIMEAYPGDEYVDLVALDVYNGAGSGKGVSVWRSFRKEGMENYFILTQLLPHKPLLICETASRERNRGEEGQTKAEWMEEMTEALRTDMSKIRLLTWFDENEKFKVNSSPESIKAYVNHIIRNDYFKGGTEDFFKVLGR